MSDPLQRIAALLPTLSHAEVRVLIVLASSHQTSSRNIAAAAGLARSNVITAIQSLQFRGLIETDQGSSTRAAAIKLAFLDTAVLPERGPNLGPRQKQESMQVVLQQDQGVVLQQDQGGPTAGPLPNKERARPRGSIDIDSNGVAVIDRLAKAKPKHYDAEQIVTARRWLHGYNAKFGREPNPHPPDDEIVARFLSIASWPQLESLLYELMAERKEPGHSYAWFVAVALQRIHGISPSAQKQIRAQLEIVKPAKRPPPHQQNLMAEADSMNDQLRAMAAAKSIR